MATVYGSAIGLGTTGMILALLVTQIVAVPFSIAFSKLAGKVGSIRMIRVAIIIYFFICAVGFYMGYSLEPSQTAYQAQFTATLDESAGYHDLSGLPEQDRSAFVEQLDELETTGMVILANETRQADFQTLIDEVLADSAVLYTEDNRADIQAALQDVGARTAAFLGDPAAAADFDFALQRSAFLFWAMAALVGTCQGGIQALSRSFFGKLIPANRSNEYFGFFDIFGKFAAVMGPALYAMIANLTGHSSYGILSLMVLFLVGLVVLYVGRRHLARAEHRGSEAARISRENGNGSA